MAQWRVDCAIVIVAAMDLMNQHDVGPIKRENESETSRTLSRDDETAENERISLHIQKKCTMCSYFCSISSVIVE